MIAYILRRLMLVVPTLFGIMVVNFFIIQAAPGGPVAPGPRRPGGPPAMACADILPAARPNATYIAAAPPRNPLWVVADQ